MSRQVSTTVNKPNLSDHGWYTICELVMDYIDLPKTSNPQSRRERMLKYCRDGLIKAGRVGREWRVRKEDLDAFLYRSGSRQQKRLMR